MKSADAITAPLGYRPDVVSAGVTNWGGMRILVTVAIWLAIGFGVTELVASFIEAHSANRVEMQKLEAPAREKSP